jgi:hypothetical protein
MNADQIPQCPECGSATDVSSVPGGFICAFPDCKGEVFIGKPRPTIPDSGSRTEFATGAVRDAMAGKGQPSRIPPNFIRSVSRRFEDGAAKYPDINGKPNWMHGIPLSRYLDAIARHSMQMAEGDATEDHVGAVGWNAAGFQWTLEQIQAGKLPIELDDRPFK